MIRQALTSREFASIASDEYPLLFDLGRERSEMLLPRDASSIPFGVFQYWNDTPDEQVGRLLDQTRRHCEADDIEWCLFSEDSAAAFLSNAFGDRYEAAFWKCVHHAQRSSFFRCCYILKHGGMWLDADLALTQSPRPLLSFDRPVFFQRRATHRYLTNWILIAEPGEIIFGEIVETILRNIEDDAFFADRIAAGDIASISGFRVVRRVVARAIHGFMQAGEDGLPPVKIIDESIHDRFIASGPQVLGSKLAYKKTERAWQRWSKRIVTETPGSVKIPPSNSRWTK